MIPKCRIYCYETQEMIVARDYRELAELFAGLDADDSLYSDPMQSTGLFDKNGKEIFGGDVVLENGWRKVAVSFGTQEIEENFGDKRIFQGFNLYLGGGYPEAVMSKHEIIGNIYENPELVEEK